MKGDGLLAGRVPNVKNKDKRKPIGEAINTQLATHSTICARSHLPENSDPTK
jgi:hypothetical protein